MEYVYVQEIKMWLLCCMEDTNSEGEGRKVKVKDSCTVSSSLHNIMECYV